VHPTRAEEIAKQKGQRCARRGAQGNGETAQTEKNHMTGPLRKEAWGGGKKRSRLQGTLLSWTLLEGGPQTKKGRKKSYTADAPRGFNFRIKRRTGLKTLRLTRIILQFSCGGGGGEKQMGRLGGPESRPREGHWGRRRDGDIFSDAGKVKR